MRRERISLPLFIGGTELKDNICKKKKSKLGIRRTGFIVAFLAPTIIAFCIFYLYPIITVFVTSFCKWDYSNITSPEFFGFQDLWNNYEYIFKKYPFFWEALKNSIHGQFLVQLFRFQLLH